MSSSVSSERTVIVIPCYNEAARLDRQQFVSFLEANPCFELLFVDDGSSDGTLTFLETFCRSQDRAAYIVLPANRGKGEAVRTGVLQALESRPDFVAYLDADLSIPPEAVLGFQEILRRRPEIELVLGARVKLLGRSISRNPWRHLLGRVFATVASLATGIPAYDTQCGAKLFRVSDVTARIFREEFVSRWIFDVEILIRLARQTGRDGSLIPAFEYPLDNWADIEGSKVTAGAYVRGAIDMSLVIARYGFGAARPRSQR